jgi:nicotinamide riboside transporter PnuC
MPCNILEEPPGEAPASVVTEELSVAPIPEEIIQPRPKQFGWAFWISVGVVLTLGFVILLGSIVHC